MQFFGKQEKKISDKRSLFTTNHATSKYRFQLYIVVGKEVELSQNL